MGLEDKTSTDSKHGCYNHTADCALIVPVCQMKQAMKGAENEI